MSRETDSFISTLQLILDKLGIDGEASRKQEVPRREHSEPILPWLHFSAPDHEEIDGYAFPKYSQAPQFSIILQATTISRPLLRQWIPSKQRVSVRFL